MVSSRCGCFATALLLLLLGVVFLAVQLCSQAHQTRHASRFRRAGDDKRNLESRIVGGYAVTDPYQYPFFVQLPNGCGGSLIHDDLILTAAHCVHSEANRVQVLTKPVHVGGTQLGSGIVRHISEIRIDPRYVPATGSYDFAIGKLDAPVYDVKPIRLNKDMDIPTDGAPMVVLGFGYTKEGALGFSQTLQRGEINYIQDCSRSAYPSGRVQDFNMFCGSNYFQHKDKAVNVTVVDACQGDSGSPLIYEQRSGYWEQIGLVAWGRGCARSNFPGVYARVAASYEWIQQVICEMSANPPSSFNTPCLCEKMHINGTTTRFLDRITGFDCVEIQVTIRYDAYAFEAGWSLVDLRVGASLITSPPGSIRSTEEGGITRSIQLPPGPYQLNLIDTYNDGWCCDYGNGSITVFDGRKELQQHNGVFHDQVAIAFDVAPSYM